MHETTLIFAYNDSISDLSWHRAVEQRAAEAQVFHELSHDSEVFSDTGSSSADEQDAKAKLRCADASCRKMVVNVAEARRMLTNLHDQLNDTVEDARALRKDLVQNLLPVLPELRFVERIYASQPSSPSSF